MMTTNNKLWLGSAIALCACAITFFWQRSATSAVRAEFEDLQRVVAKAPPSVDQQGIYPPAVTSAPQPETLSVEELAAMLTDDSTETAGPYAAFTGMLEHIRHYSTDEVLELIEALGNLIRRDKSQEQKLAAARHQLMVIVADDAPEHILDIAKRAPDEVRSAAFAGLVKLDPQRAQEYLDGVDWPMREVQMAKAVLFSAWLKRDMLRALELFRDGGWSLNWESASAIGNACNDPASREALWQAARDETDPAVRLQLSKGLTVGELMRGGAAGLRKAFLDADFLDANLKAELVDEFAADAMAVEPDETAAWIRESVPPKDAPQALATALGEWAQRDFNAAGTWLGKQPSSVERDQAIAGFASAVTKIDPTAAATWAGEIIDPILRQATLAKTLKQWKATDPTAADAWLETQGQQE